MIQLYLLSFKFGHQGDLFLVFLVVFFVSFMNAVELGDLELFVVNEGNVRLYGLCFPLDAYFNCTDTMIGFITKTESV